MAQAIKVGDKVWFKNDIEGIGVVVEVQEERGWSGTHRTYVIANGSQDCSPWHPMAQMDWKHRCTVVYCDEDHTWLD
jgi:hypothetical protein